MDGGSTVRSEILQSSRVMTTSSHPPKAWVGSATCCVNPNCERRSRRRVVSGKEVSFGVCIIYDKCLGERFKNFCLRMSTDLSVCDSTLFHVFLVDSLPLILW